MSGCNGWNYHVFALGADCCSICGFRRYPPAALTPLPEPPSEQAAEEKCNR